jgi:DNA-binding MarR family transcriptional regulator
MVETTSAETRGDPMEIFLMVAIVRAGLDTLYSLQKAAGLQPGSLSKVIERLCSAGFLERGEGKKRGRRVLSLTKRGESFLALNWKGSLDPHREAESLLRSATVALIMGGPGAAIDFLYRSGAERERRETGKRNLFSPRSTPMDLLGAMREEYASRRWAMEARLLHDLGERLITVFRDSPGE